MPNHKEAFCLMWYGCKCGHCERIWNSRDGVTPFGTTCPSCGEASLHHVAWGSDTPTPEHKPHRGQRFWRDGTPDEAEAIMRKRVEHYKGTPYEPTPERAIELIAAARSGSDESEFRKGWPTLDRAKE